MEPEMEGSHLDITIRADLTALKRMAEEFIILQYHMRIDGTKKIGSRDIFAGPFVKALASPYFNRFRHVYMGRTTAVIKGRKIWQNM
eukprot:10209081-Ditylum_brightwellii.AAC.1